MDLQQAKTYLKQLLTINSVEGEAEPGMPFGKGVYECLQTALSIMDEQGLHVKNGNGYYGYGEIGEGELFGILCHLDVVPVGKGWTYPPFGAVEENGKIYARGALDDKSPFIACLYALSRLLEEGCVPQKRIRFILGCDEESGWKCMEQYKEQEEMPALGISPDGDFPVINCEKGIVYHSISYPKPNFLKYIRAGERPNMVPDEAEAKVLNDERIVSYALACGCVVKEEGEYVTVRAKGVSAHGSHPENGNNALIKLLHALSPYGGWCKEMYEAFRYHDGRGVGLAISDEKSGALTLNLGTVNTIGEKVVFELDVRHPISCKKEHITETLRARLFMSDVKETFYHLPLYVEEDHPLVQGLLQAYNKVTGENASPIAIGGGTYARVLPCGVAFGPCFPNSKAGIHCANEYIDLKEFEKMSEIYYEALKGLCFTE